MLCAFPTCCAAVGLISKWQYTLRVCSIIIFQCMDICQRFYGFFVFRDSSPAPEIKSHARSAIDSEFAARVGDVIVGAYDSVHTLKNAFAPQSE